MVLGFIFVVPAWSCGELGGFCLLTRFFPNRELGLIKHLIVGWGTEGPSASLGMTEISERTDAVHFDDQWNSRVTNLASCLPVLVRV